MYSPRITWSTVEAGWPTEGWHMYSPESESLADWTRRKETVMSPFSVIWLTPPRGESYVIDCKTKVVVTSVKSFYCLVR
jgi:hypothetical protein